MTANGREPSPGAILRDIYNDLVRRKEVTRAVDKLPYTDDFVKIYARLPARVKVSRNEAWLLLLNRRKRGQCPFTPPRKRKAKAS